MSKKKPLVIEHQSTKTGAEQIKDAAAEALRSGYSVVIIKNDSFRSSAFGYSGQAVLVNTTVHPTDARDVVVGPESIGVPNARFAVLKPHVAKHFLKR